MDNKYIRRLKIQQKSVIKKTYAAICMLLVAATLLSATSYAWLVLSQAPEVSNVTTTIGANGNLEIALGKNIGETAIGDSFNKNDVTIANRTWGNLIDLTDESYGLQAITLRPAILNSAGGAINMLHPLAYPIYGADGRVQYIYANNMFAGTYNGSQFVTSANDYGVHGIGTTQYHAPGVEGTFGPLSQRQEIFYNAQNNLWTMTSSSYTSLCESSQSVLMAYCMDGTGISASDFNLDTFSQRVADFVSAANEELRYIFTILAASESTSADNYFMAMDLLKQEYPDYETLRSLVSTAIQTEEVDGVGTAIAELRAFQNASNQLQTVIASGTVNSSDGYSREEIAQTVGLIFDLEKTSFTETSKDYWSKVISHLHYRKYVSGKYWWWDYLDDNDFAVNDLTNKLSYSNGQDNDSREATVYEIEHTHTYSIYQSLPLDKLDSAIAGLYASHWIYWDNCSEEYILLQDEITELEAQVKQLEDSGALEADIQLKTDELSDKQAQLQSLVDGEIYALDDDRLEAIQTVMTDTIEAMRQYTLWAIAYCACDGRVPDDAYHHVLEIASSADYIHPRTAYQALCNYGVTPQAELANMVASFEKLEKDLLFLRSAPNGTDEITWNELGEELQRIFGIIEHRFYFSGRNMIDSTSDDYVSYSSSYVPEDVATPMDVMTKLNEELDAYENAVADFKYKSAEHQITYRYLDEENKQPWAQALGLLLTIYNAAYPFEYGTAEYTLADQLFSTEHSMWHAQGFQLSISVGVGSEDNFNESGLTVRQTRFKEAQENISYYQNQLITAAVNPGKDMAALLMQIIAGESNVSLATISEYLDNLQQQLEYGEAMMYQATLAMAASNYAEDNVYEYAYSDRAPENAAGMIELLRSYNFDATVLNAFDQRMALLNTQKALLNQSLALLKNYQSSETGALKVEQISAAEAVALLNPVLGIDSLTLYGYVAAGSSGVDDPSRYVHTVLYTGFGSPSVQVNGNQATVSGSGTVAFLGNLYLSLGRSLSGSMLALAKSETESYTPPTDALRANDVIAAETGTNRHSYTIDTSATLYTLNLRTADAPYSLATNLWTYTGNTEYISANQILVDVYGYSIDLSFRTNADNSDLLLQTEAVDRIYDDGDPYTDTSMGAGSYMEFEILDPSYTTDMAKEYMSCLRVVLTDTNTGYIYGYASLDMTAAEVIGVTVKAPLRLYNKDTGLMVEGDTAQYICHLEKNLEKNLTVYVYLDGAKATQSLASATNEQTLSGVMNIQFCSSADLKPAFNGNGVTDNGGSQTPTNPSTPINPSNPTDPSNPEVPTPTLPTVQSDYYVEHDGNNTYSFYTLNSNGSRDYELTFTGSVDAGNNTIVVETVSVYPENGVVIPAIATYTTDNEEYAVYIDPTAPFANLGTESAAVSFVPVDGEKVGISSADLSDLFDRNEGTDFVSLDLSGMDTSTATDMSYLFYGLLNLTYLNISDIDTTNVTDMKCMFNGCRSLTELDVGSFDTASVTDMSYMFAGCGYLSSVDLSGFDTSQVMDMNHMFAAGFFFDAAGYCNSGFTSLNLSSFNTSNVTNIAAMFSGCSQLTSLDVSGFDTSKVTDMSSVFNSCHELIEIDVGGFDTSRVTAMNYMFQYCYALQTLDVSGFDTANVTSMGGMFDGCKSLTSLDISGFDTTKVTVMSHMFNSCSSLTALNVKNFDTANVTSMEGMFAGCSELTILDVSNFYTGNVGDLSHMFSRCSKLTNLDVSGFDTSSAWDMVRMFYGCHELAMVDMSGWDIAKVENIADFFTDCANLQTIITPITIGDVSINLPGTYLCEINGSTFTVIGKTVPSQATLEKVS